MLRTPEPKDQAQLLTRLLADAGFEMGHQKALQVIARLHGHRSWNVMQTAQKIASVEPAIDELPSLRKLNELVIAARTVVEMCEEVDLTDVDLGDALQDAVGDLEDCVDRLASSLGDDVEEPHYTHGFDIDDVFEVRPDLSREEARQVLERADREADANVGVNWVVLETHADILFPPYAVEATCHEADGKTYPVTIRLDNGQMFRGTLQDVVAQKNSAKTPREPLTCNSFVVLPDDSDVDMGPGEDAIQDGDEAELLKIVTRLRDHQQATGKHLLHPLPPVY